jgi:hypothetical protein
MGARCVAGIQPDTGEWIRPVSNSGDGELGLWQIKLSNDGDPLKFDLIRMGVSKPVPSNSQPENWLIDGTPWMLIDRPTSNQHRELLRTRLFRGDELFGSTSDCVSAASFLATPGEGSLALIKPGRPLWSTGTSMRGRKQLRVSFQLVSTRYDLVVTDPAFENRARDLNLASARSSELGISNEDALLFTISLGEAFLGNCYKLVAAVLELPNGWVSID